jgi:hypothetical protein
LEVKKLAVLLCASLAFAGLVSGAAVAGKPNPGKPDPPSGSGSEKAKVRSLLAYQTRLTNEARWAQLYRTYAPHVRARCPYRRFAAAMNTIRTLVGGRISLRRVRIRVTGQRASATYEIVSRGHVVSSMRLRRPDLFVRIGGRWFDDSDAGSPC